MHQDCEFLRKSNLSSLVFTDLQTLGYFQICRETRVEKAEGFMYTLILNNIYNMQHFTNMAILIVIMLHYKRFKSSTSSISV